MVFPEMTNAERAKRILPLDAGERNAVTRVVMEDARREWPVTYRLFTGVRYELPAYRQADYPHHANAGVHDALCCVGVMQEPELPAGAVRADHTFKVCFTAINQWVTRGASALFLERELAEALVRTELPEGFGPEDLKWRRPAFRLFLPAGLFVLNAPEWGRLECTCLTVIRMLKGETLSVDPRLQAEVLSRQRRLRRRDGPIYPTPCKDDRMTVTLQMRPTPDFIDAVDYYSDGLLNDRGLAEIAQQFHETRHNPQLWSDEEKIFLAGIKRLAFNAVLYMGAVPIEYQPEVVRPAREKKGQFRAEIQRARFLGQELYRPSARPAKPGEPTGFRQPENFRSGHWKRIWHGPKKSESRLQWIAPYRAGGFRDNETV